MKAVLQTLASSEYTDATFLVVMVLPVWDDLPWTSKAIRGHNNMSTLTKFLVDTCVLCPLTKQTDDESVELKPANWPIVFVLKANAMGREARVI